MRKALLKRIKFTASGKMLVRPGRQNHFNAKMARKNQLRQHGMVALHHTVEKKLRAYVNQ